MDFSIHPKSIRAHSAYCWGWGGRRREVPGAFRPTSLAELGSSRFRGRFCLKNKIQSDRGRHLTSNSTLHMHAHTHNMCPPHTCTHTTCALHTSKRTHFSGGCFCALRIQILVSVPRNLIVVQTFSIVIIMRHFLSQYFVKCCTLSL